MQVGGGGWGSRERGIWSSIEIVMTGSGWRKGRGLTRWAPCCPAAGREAEVGSAVQARARREQLKAGNYDGKRKERFREGIRIRQSQKLSGKGFYGFQSPAVR